MNQRVEPKYSERHPRQHHHFVHCTSHTTSPGIEADENCLVSRGRWDAVREQVLVMVLLLEVNCHRLNFGQLTAVPHRVTSAVRRCCEEIMYRLICAALVCWSGHSVKRLPTKWMIRGSNLGKGQDLLRFSTTPRLIVGPTKPPVNGHSGRGVKFSTHLHLVPMLRMSGTIPLHPHTLFVVWTATSFLSVA